MHPPPPPSPPPLPPAPLIFKEVPPPPPDTNPLNVAQSRPAGAFLVQLLVFKNRLFKDHWAYWVCSNVSTNYGVVIHATGDVKYGFKFEIKRSYDFDNSTKPTTRIPLQWVDGKHFDEKAMLNDGKLMLDYVPVCGFEASAYKVKAPGGSLNAVHDKNISGKNTVTQRDCQTWIVESADQLVEDGIFSPEVAAYLHGIKQ